SQNVPNDQNTPIILLNFPMDATHAPRSWKCHCYCASFSPNNFSSIQPRLKVQPYSFRSPGLNGSDGIENGVAVLPEYGFEENCRFDFLLISQFLLTFMQSGGYI